MPHHVRRTDREIADSGRVEALLVDGRLCHIALVDEHGPYVVTMSYGFHAESRRLYFHAAREGRKIRAVGADPRACATVVFDRGYKTGECAHPYESVVLGGSMRVVDDPSEKVRALRVLVEHQEKQTPDAFSAMGFDDPKRVASVNALAFDIEWMTAKEGE